MSTDREADNPAVERARPRRVSDSFEPAPFSPPQNPLERAQTLILLPIKSIVANDAKLHGRVVALNEQRDRARSTEAWI